MGLDNRIVMNINVVHGLRVGRIRGEGACYQQGDGMGRAKPQQIVVHLDVFIRHFTGIF